MQPVSMVVQDHHARTLITSAIQMPPKCLHVFSRAPLSQESKKGGAKVDRLWALGRAGATEYGHLHSICTTEA